MKPENTDIHGGNPSAIADKLGVKEPEVKFDFSVNLNPLGPPPEITKILLNPEEIIQNYPQIDCREAEIKLAENLEIIDKNKLLIGNGATELFSLAIQVLKPSEVILPEPTYSGYEEICRKNGIAVSDFTGNIEDLTPSPKQLIFICYPNNPTGKLVNRNLIEKLINNNPESFFVIDESFMDFVPDNASLTFLNNDLPDNVIIIKSLTKFFAIAGLRLGFAVCAPGLAEKMRSLRLPWSVNGLAQASASAVYQNKDYLKKSIDSNIKNRECLIEMLSEFPDISPTDSKTNFVLCRLNNSKATDLQRQLLAQRILIRCCQDIAGLDDQYFRLAVRTETEVKALYQELKKILPHKQPNKKLFEKTTPAIMVVGTTSNAGKSIINTALCRYFANQGMKVAPFKAQNMALNSFVTQEGGEMGRAQVVQAEACRIEPHIDMNPVLLKPQGNATSQVIINGQPKYNLNAVDYYQQKIEIRREAFKAYDRLSSRFDIIIMEGAGSPAEINLQEEDFVNLRMAKYANAKAVLVADIDRGGVFASIYGTIQLLPPEWKKLIKGIIINKFRGDKTLLESGIDEIQKLTGIPVLGVMPYINDISIDDEDSLGLETKKLNTEAAGNKIDIAVIRLPMISNFTDFLPLELQPEIEVRYITTPAKIGTPDLIIIPGSKNTISDMKFLRESGFETFLKNAGEKNIPLMGICGGYQMLGNTIDDPQGIEGPPQKIKGLELLPIDTILHPEKELAQVSGAFTGNIPFLPEDIKFKGYEIHSGKTATPPETALIKITERSGITCSEPAGTCSGNGLVFGCYIHGFFDIQEVREAFIEWLGHDKGLKSQKIDSSIDKYDKLTDIFQKNIDMERLISVLDLEYIR